MTRGELATLHAGETSSRCRVGVFVVAHGARWSRYDTDPLCGALDWSACVASLEVIAGHEAGARATSR
ncbi:MAG TPA: hypothetical protein VMV46_16000, partial [Thermoanaerobaculia bacterium]|nr:hypothetical protein [Thermoanaerobaculia bacterium]